MNEKQKIISGVVAIMASHIVVFSLGEVSMRHRLQKKTATLSTLMNNAYENIAEKSRETGMTEQKLMEVVNTEMSFIRLALR